MTVYGLKQFLIDNWITIKENILKGNRWVVDIDLEKLFDKVNNDILLKPLIDTKIKLGK